MKRVIFAFMVIAVSSIPAFSKYSGGSGTPGDPYRIANAADLNTLAVNTADYYSSFIMTADIDLDPNLPGNKIYTTAVIAPDTDNTSSGFQGADFKGVFDGAGHKIFNLNLDGAGNDYLGLFGDVNGGQIKNLGVQNVYIARNANYAYFHGGIIGWNSGNLSRCYSTGNIYGGYFLNSYGGLVGQNDSNGYIDNCFSDVNVTIDGWEGVFAMGGLAGGNAGHIANCYSVGRVQLYGDGLIGYNTGTVTASFWDVNSSGKSTSAGGTGKTTAEMRTKATFTNAGWDFNNVWKINEGVDYTKLFWMSKYSGGTGTAGDPYQIANAADLNTLANEVNDYNKCFIMIDDIDLDPNLHGNQVFAGAVIAKDNNSDASFQGNIFTGVFDGADHKILNINIEANGVRYDYLGLFGDVNGGQIKNLHLENFQISGGNDSNFIGGIAGYICNGNISNCSTSGTISGGTPSGPAGGLVGEISNVDINNCFSSGNLYGGYCSANFGGLVGHMNYGSISNSYSTADINNTAGGSGNHGGLVGLVEYGTIRKCYATGTLSCGGNSSCLGGLAGTSQNSADINMCFATGNVKPASRGSSYYFGGLVGTNSGRIGNSYSIGEVNTYSNSDVVGGLVGNNSGGIISVCFSTGRVTGGDYYHGGLTGWASGYVIGCYWDVNTSGQATSGDGIGKTTAQMKTLSTFTSSGWNFSNIWRMRCEGMNYPKLNWQVIPEADFVCPDGVDFVDYSFFAERWMNTNCAANNDCDSADFDFSGTVNISDMAVFAEHWLQGL